jgi:hypothetical protein
MGKIFLEPLERCPKGLTQENKKARAEKFFGCELKTTREVVNLYGVCAHQVMRKVRSGQIPPPKKFQNANYFVAAQHPAEEGLRRR